MRGTLQRAVWPIADAEEALSGLARAAGMPVDESAVGAGGPAPSAAAGPAAAVEAHARRLGLEIEPLRAAFGEAERLVRGSPPALIVLPGGRGLLAAVRRRGRRVTLLAPTLRRCRVPAGAIAAAMTAERAERERPAVDELLDAVGVAPSRRGRARRAVIAERLAGARLTGCLLLRLPPGAPFRSQARQERLGVHFASFALAYAASYALLLASWWVLGRGVLAGRFELGWLAAWSLTLLTMVPLRALSVWSRARLSVGFGALLKRRLIQGALRLQPEEVRHQGAGQLLGRVLESESVEALALNGGFLTVVAAIELAFSALVLAAGAAGAAHVALLALWLALTVALGRRFYRARREWTENRVAMTHDLVERMVGHRTRLAQEPRNLWHLEEDRDLEAYHRRSNRFDRHKTWLLGLVGRGWLAVGIAVLVPAFAAGGDRVALAIGLGGVLTAYRGFLKLSEGFNHLSGALVAWRQAAELYDAAARREACGSAALAEGSRTEAPPDDAANSPSGPAVTEGAAAPVILEAIDVGFRHQGRPRATLESCSLAIRRGERILLQGSSGGGKSTLAALLAGLRPVDAGLILLDGLDLGTVGTARWRRRVVAAPQFHENHVLTETFAFNLLLGRRWPPEAEDLAEAAAVCRELGLGELLARMPGGLDQPVGETGWQLSHGEKSRLFVARALLQGGELLILDESFAALDPASLEQALDCVLRRASSLLLIAHP